MCQRLSLLGADESNSSPLFSPSEVRSEGVKELVGFEGWPPLLTPSFPPQVLCERCRNNDFMLTQGIHGRRALHTAEAGGMREGIFPETMRLRGRPTMKVRFPPTVKQNCADLNEAGPLVLFKLWSTIPRSK